MIIANPISDLAFKWMMEDKRIAKFFIETLLEEIVEKVDFKPQELTYLVDDHNPEKRLAATFAIFRVDFVATIKTGQGKYKKILIEIQKVNHQTDIMRFRKYLAEHYLRQDTIETEVGPRTEALPIVTIYILGFKLPQIPTPVLKVARNYVDQINKKIITGHDEFIEKLTHESHIVQIPRIEGKVATRLEQLLSFFEQKYYIDEDGMLKNYPYPIVSEEMKLVAESLEFAGADPVRRNNLTVERDAMREWYALIAKQEDRLKEQTKAMEEQTKAMEKQIIVIEEKDKKLVEKDKALAESQKAYQDLLKQIVSLKKKKK